MLSFSAELVAAALLSGAAPAQRIENLNWLAGDWKTSPGQQWTEEHWNVPRARAMLGTSRSGSGTTMREYEFLRITHDTDGGLTYWGSPGGKTPVPFRLVRSGPMLAVFENPAHDYPQRITYRRTGSKLVATISDIDSGKAMSWTYRRK